MEGEHEHEQTPPVVAPVIAPVESVTEHTIDHAAKIAHIEEQQAKQVEDMMRSLSELESRLQEATGSRASALEEKISALEAKIEALTVKPVEQEVSGAGVDFEVPEIEESPEPPKKENKGIAARRKKRKAGNR